jgi:tyrosinase
MAAVRKSEATLTAIEWATLINAINALHGVTAAAPAYRDFVAVHVRAMNPMDPVGMSWGVHTMGSMMIGRNFLAWHRKYLLRLEQRLQQVDPSITIPYWDWMTNRSLPAALSRPAILRGWSVTRQWDPSQLPVPADLQAVSAQTAFTAFQRRLEHVHGYVHDAVGGTMAGPSSPADPLFFLHHANIDRLWSQWQRAHPRAAPPNLNETLQPSPLFGVKVSSILSIGTLGYRYG